ncbi:hypothetical protein GCM10028791_27350 [Echinicola sediminis]
MDRFADIGNRVAATRLDLLEEKEPIEKPFKLLPVGDSKAYSFGPVDKMDSAEELEEELRKFRDAHEPFLKDLAPSLSDLRTRIPLKEFDWMASDGDHHRSFNDILVGKGNWEKVEIPHYGPPQGRATAYYRKEIDFDRKQLQNQSAFICFKAVDYLANVYLNGKLVGSHEGFFAPFEFNITDHLVDGKNTLLIEVKNDYTTTGSKDPHTGERFYGDKIYAVTGLGYDNFYDGGHQCAPGMGIYQDCFIELRSPLHVHDIFVRPMVDKNQAEIWLEVNNFDQTPKNLKVRYSIYGQNFQDTLHLDEEYIPTTVHIPGVGDLAKPTDWQKKQLQMGYGVNYLRWAISMDNFRFWDPKTPWLYQLQISLIDEDGNIVDNRKQQFGMRSFEMDTVNIPKGNLYLNGEKIRLRGANTMGFLQQDVFKQDFDQLIDDILLAKICNMNFLRLTQRPVQPEIYEYADKLGIMLQTDLPLFGGLRYNKWAEAVKQAEEMERLVRSHPSNIMVTYINERFVNAEGHPQRNMNTAEQYYRFFKAADQAVHMANPDRVIKAGDGDYDPPSPGLPDHHCYNTWYNGHALPLGKLYKGYWSHVKPGWLYACGEFGAEGLDNYPVMQKYYPRDWLPQTPAEEEAWTANKIVAAQTQKFHYMWFNTQNNVKDWIAASQDHQAWAVKMATESFRRDPRMVSFAVHLFIDAWPAGWMKTIMDVDRKPKKAYFAYRDALTPLLVSLRSDQSRFYEGDTIDMEAWISNDLNTIPKGTRLSYQLKKGNQVLWSNQVLPEIPENGVSFQGYARHRAPKVNQRTSYTMEFQLLGENGEAISTSSFDYEVFPKRSPIKQKVYAVGESPLWKVLRTDNLITAANLSDADVIMIFDMEEYQEHKKRIDQAVKKGKRAIFYQAPVGTNLIADQTFEVHPTSMGSYYFASPQTGHPITKNGLPFDFKMWYSHKTGMIEPFLSSVVVAENFAPILGSGLTNWVGDQGNAMASGEYKFGKGSIIVSQIDLEKFIGGQPMADSYFQKLISWE